MRPLKLSGRLSKHLTIGVCVASLAGGLAACGGEGKDSTIGGSVAAGPANFEEMLSLLPEDVNVTYENESYDERSGKTTLQDLKITFGDIDDRGLAIDELIVAGLDGNFIQSRIAGTNFDQSAVVVDYLEANNLSLFGAEQFYEGVTKAYLDSIDELVEDVAGEDIPDIEQSIDKLEYVIENILVDDFELLPFVLEGIEEGATADVEANPMAVLQVFAAYSRAFGAKEVSMTGLSTVMEMTQNGQAISMDMKMPKAGVEGWRGGDYDLSYAEDMVFDMDVPIPVEEGVEVPFETMEMSGRLASYSVENIRLDAALSWLARGEMPPTTQTDLMSLGVWDVKDVSFTMFGKPFYSIQSSQTDMSQFHWLIPTRITSKTENLVYDIGSLVESLANFAPDDEEGSEELAMAAQVLDVLKQYDLSAPSMDLDFNWQWDEETGQAGLSLETGLDGYGTFAYNLSGAIAGFDDWVSAVKAAEEADDEEVFEAFANQHFAFDGQSYLMTDRGGNDRLFHAAIDIAKALKDDVPEVAVLAAYDVETLKLLASSAIIGGAAFGAEEFPALNDYAKAFAAYVSEGGSFKIAMEPEVPVRMKAFRKLADIDSPEEGQAFLETLNFTVEHTEP